MKILLDTQVFLWMIADAPELSPKARSLILDAGNLLYLSLASIWEMAIKVSLRKLQFKESLETLIPEELRANSISQLEIGFRHVARVVDLPFHHRDPFDRLLISQAQVENIPILSADRVFDRYRVKRLW